MVSLWNSKRWRWNNLLPAQAHVCSEDEHGRHIEEAPAEGLEDLKLETVDVAHISGIFELAVGHPEEVDGVRRVQDGLQVQVHQVWRWAYSVWLCDTEAELEQVDGHEREKGDSGNRKVQLSSGDCHVERDLVCALQGHAYVQQCTDSDVLLDDVGFKTESRSIQTHVEVSIPVEVIRTKEDMEIANGMDDDENKEEHGGPGEARAVICENDVLLSKDSEDDLLQETKNHVAKCSHPSGNLSKSLHTCRLVLLILRVVTVLGATCCCCSGCCGRWLRLCLIVVVISSCATTNISDGDIRGILANDIRWVDHVELFSGILACEGKDCKLTPRMILKEVGHVEHLASNHNPAIALRRVLCHFFHGISCATSFRFLLLLCNCRPCCRCRFTSFVHVVLIGPSGKLGGFHLATKTTASEHIQVDLLHIIAKDVLGGCDTCNTTKHHAIEQGVSAKTVVAMHTASNLTCTVETLDDLAIVGHHSPLNIDLQPTHAVVDDRSNDGNVEFLRLDIRALDNVVVKLLATACHSAGLIPRLAAWICRP